MLRVARRLLHLVASCCILLHLVASCCILLHLVVRCALHQNITTLADAPAFRDFEKASSELQRVNFTGLSRQVSDWLLRRALISRRISDLPWMRAATGVRCAAACVLCAVAHT